MNRKSIVPLLLGSVVALGAAPAWAQSNAEIRHDNREVQRDNAEINHDANALQQDQAQKAEAKRRAQIAAQHGNDDKARYYARQAQKEKQEIKGDKAELREDSAERREDVIERQEDKADRRGGY